MLDGMLTNNRKMTMATLRVWHPSRDAYHSTYRMLLILFARSDHECSLKKLYLLDFFLLFPNLLYKVSLPMELRKKFRELDLKRPEKQFIEYPSISSLFRSIDPYQKAAVKQLAARGLLSKEDLQEGRAILRPESLGAELRQYLDSKIEVKSNLLRLIANGIGELPLEGPKGIYHYTRLPRRL